MQCALGLVTKVTLHLHFNLPPTELFSDPGPPEELTYVHLYLEDTSIKFSIHLCKAIVITDLQ